MITLKYFYLNLDNGKSFEISINFGYTVKRFFYLDQREEAR